MRPPLRKPSRFDRALVHAFVVHPRIVFTAMLLALVLAFFAGLFVEVFSEPCTPEAMYSRDPHPECEATRAERDR